MAPALVNISSADLCFDVPSYLYKTLNNKQILTYATVGSFINQSVLVPIMRFMCRNSIMWPWSLSIMNVIVSDH